MSQATTDELLRVSPLAAARMGERLLAAGYTAAGVEAVAGADLTTLGHRAIPVLVHRTRGGSPLETLVRLFLACVPVRRVDAVDALGGTTLEDLTAAGVVRPAAERDAVECTVQLCHHGDLVVGVDPGAPAAGIRLPPDHVMGLSPSTLMLARVTDRAPTGAVLDVGTGCGLQALLAASHAERVVATDLNPRAVAMTRLSLLLNGIENVATRLGDLVAPVAGESFDLVVSNPPFVVGPPVPQLYLSGGLDGDDLCANLARSLPALLTPAGRATMLANWAPRSGRPWQEHLAAWFEGSGCDVWVIRRGSEPVDGYAALWVESERDDVGEFPWRFDEWMRWYEARAIETVDFGVVTLRRRDDGRESLRCEDVQDAWDDVDGASLAEAFTQRIALDALDDEALLSVAPRLSERARLRRECVAVGHEWVAVAATLRRDGGLGAPGGVDPHGEHLVASADGTRTVAALVTAMAAAVEMPVDDLRPQALTVIRRLVERGILTLPGR